jgi:hypothetical protein
MLLTAQSVRIVKPNVEDDHFGDFDQLFTGEKDRRSIVDVLSLLQYLIPQSFPFLVCAKNRERHPRDTMSEILGLTEFCTIY